MGGLVLDFLVGAILIAVGAASGRLSSTSAFRRLSWSGRIKRSLLSYQSLELEKLRNWPSLLSTRAIDFSKDYVELILIEGGSNKLLKRGSNIPVDDLLESPIPTAIVSGPGQGKSTLLLHLYKSLLDRLVVDGKIQKAERIPILLNARNEAAKDISLSDSINDHFNAYTKDQELSKLISEDALKMNRLVLLIDGLDEVEQGLSRFVMRIRSFGDKFEGCSIILTSRPVSPDIFDLIRSGARPFKEAAIAPLSVDSKKQFIHNYVGDDPELEVEVWELIQSRKFLRELTKVTINLLLVINAISDGVAINSRADFYRHAINTLLFALPNKKEFELKYTLKQKELLLAKISYEALVNKKRLNTDLVWSVDGENGIKSQAFFEILDTCGILKMSSQGRYDFPHRTFSEYFAAVHARNHLSDMSEQSWSDFASEQNGVILSFLAELLDDVSDLTTKLLAAPEPNALLLAGVLSSGTPLDLEPFDKSEELIWTHLQDSNELLRPDSSARQILAMLPRFPRDLSERGSLYTRLISMLMTPTTSNMSELVEVDETQIFAMRFLLHTASAEIVPNLIDLFSDRSVDTYVRFKAGEMLSNLADAELLEKLEEYYHSNSDTDVRRFVVEAAVKTRDAAANTILSHALADEDLVIKSLAKLGTVYIRDRLFLENATAVSIAGDHEKERQIMAGSALEPSELLKIAADRESDYRLDAFRMLMNKCPGNAISYLVAIATDHSEEPFYQCEATQIIGSHAPDDELDSLSKIFVSRYHEANEVGAGARGYAIEYLAHRNKTNMVLDCLANNDFDWRVSSEVCKIVWSVASVLKKTSNELSAKHRLSIAKLIDQTEESDNERVIHWRDQIQKELKRLSK